MRLRYRCPDCRTTNNLHRFDCEFEGVERSAIERAYTDLLACLSAGTHSEDALQQAVPGRWSELHAAVLRRLRTDQRVVGDDSELRLLEPEAYKERVATPTHGPLETIHQRGSVPGCHDHSLFALIAYYEMVGLSWEETREEVLRWLRDTGSWDRGGFDEDTPAEVVDAKRHVYDQGYGWKQAAEEAAAVIERRLGT